MSKKNEVLDPNSIDIDFGADANIGQEDMNHNDFIVPRLGQAQALSAVMKKADGKYIEGIQVGDFYNTVTKRIFDGEKGLLVVPATFTKSYIEWRPRKDGGGIVQNHGDDASILNTCTKDDKGKWINAAKNNIVETNEYVVFIVNEEDGSFEQAIVSFSGANIRDSKILNTLVRQLTIQANGRPINPAIFYSAFRFTAGDRSNSNGDTWMGIDIKRECDTVSLVNGKHLYLAAKAMNETIKSGNYTVAGEDGNDDMPM